MGVPLVCAVFAAWAPQPTMWRMPLAAASCVLISLAGCVRIANYLLLLYTGAIFLLSWTLLTFIHRTQGVRLVLPDLRGATANNGKTARFSIRYTLGFTAIVAVLFAIAKLVRVESSLAHLNFGRFLSGFLAEFESFSFLMLPILAIGLIVLGRGNRLPAKVAAVLLGVVFASLLTTVTYRLLESATANYTFGQIWWMAGVFSMGATLEMLISTVVLRFAGYRLDRKT